MDSGKRKINPILIGGIVATVVLVVAYVGISLYYTKHFYHGTEINGIEAAGKTADEVENEIKQNTENYTLTINGRNDYQDKISSKDIDLQYVSDGTIKQIKDGQNGFGWIVSSFTKKNSELEVNVSYNQDKLDNAISNLNCLDEKNITKPQNAKVEYDGNEFVIKEEVNGNQINKDSLQKAITEKIESGDSNLDIEQEECYENPVYTKDSEEVTNALDTMKNYQKASITYEIGSSSEKVDSAKISPWIYTDDNLAVQVNSEQVKKYVQSLASKYNTIYKTRSFKTTRGDTVNVVGGDYGWQIDINGETQELIKNITSSETVSREPKYSQKAFQHGSNDYGNSYVEVNLTMQHLWVYIDGAAVVDSDFVSGNVSAGHATPGGTYMLKYKQRDKVLVGSNNEYQTPVKYWMPFNGGIGLHDLNRSVYGGQVYQTNGSHGCINLPEEKAAQIFNVVYQGMPVVCCY